MTQILSAACALAVCILTYQSNENARLQTELQRQQLRLALDLYDEAHGHPRRSWSEFVWGDQEYSRKA